jgi:hypothetical protein
MLRVGAEVGEIATGMDERGDGTDMISGATGTYTGTIDGTGATTFGAAFTTTIIDTTGLAGIAPTEDEK